MRRLCAAACVGVVVMSAGAMGDTARRKMSLEPMQSWNEMMHVPGSPYALPASPARDPFPMCMAPADERVNPSYRMVDPLSKEEGEPEIALCRNTVALAWDPEREAYAQVIESQIMAGIGLEDLQSREARRARAALLESIRLFERGLVDGGQASKKRDLAAEPQLVLAGNARARGGVTVMNGMGADFKVSMWVVRGEDVRATDGDWMPTLQGGLGADRPAHDIAAVVNAGGNGATSWEFERTPATDEAPIGGWALRGDEGAETEAHEGELLVVGDAPLEGVDIVVFVGRTLSERAAVRTFRFVDRVEWVDGDGIAVVFVVGDGGEEKAQ